MIGPGKYDDSLSLALRDCKASQGILFVVDGYFGPSFCCQLGILAAKLAPEMLRRVADEIEKDVNTNGDKDEASGR